GLSSAISSILEFSSYFLPLLPSTISRMATALESALRRAIDGEVRFDAGTRAIYSTDASNYRQVPIAVVIPRHQGDVLATLSLAREHSIPILARGGGTSL